jgi:hypothetical protein
MRPQSQSGVEWCYGSRWKKVDDVAWSERRCGKDGTPPRRGNPLTTSSPRLNLYCIIGAGSTTNSDLNCPSERRCGQPPQLLGRVRAYSTPPPHPRVPMAEQLHTGGYIHPRWHHGHHSRAFHPQRPYILRHCRSYGASSYRRTYSSAHRPHMPANSLQAPHYTSKPRRRKS